ncbi:DUF1236 domain-containing protein [Sinorhizobium alkalisoli]|uniref:Uncharacterized protein n=1 Tax=Sinorhizobium alkalisoli TaxID=1752398 RepID=A0A1E3VHW4_9HYPH|nr:DUF1236 domain-containing protein [Sinorhizobium alkalisoli]MCA1494648.1 DUF1236 domain-containing protein [Ensifer sp. NBAIM29]MCG5477814.1 DUF1236 domain-containing protein [Sinorhizobium alkalisoli]ODR92691.1 hypothetical protein A8M32_03960 [Sinorhizobium alkalisoli]QFI66233.1 hypothetical protein EKH55_1359 [Sinorhizobium alkalisoli]
MKAKIFVASVIAAGVFAAPALAGDNDAAVTGAAGGAATGAIIGGPVGAAIGGAVGLAAGAVLSPPPKPVVAYVEQQPIPAETIRIEQPIVVGKPLPRTVMLTPVPENPAYAYAVVNQQRVIVDPKTYTVVQVIQ